MTILAQQQLREATERLIAEGENCWPATVERFTELANPAAILSLLDKVEQLEKSLKLVQTHAGTAYNRGRQAGIADQERTAREAIAAMDLARDQMMDENERFTDLLEKAEQERDQLKAENAQLRRIVSECATACGAGVSPECSLAFMAGLPREIELAMTKEQP